MHYIFHKQPPKVLKGRTTPKEAAIVLVKMKIFKLLDDLLGLLLASRVRSTRHGVELCYLIGSRNKAIKPLCPLSNAVRLLIQVTELLYCSTLAYDILVLLALGLYSNPF